jgi:peroxiredoxin
MRSISSLILAAGLTTPAGAAGYNPQVGDRHPDFTLPDVGTGKPKSLSDFRGKKVLLIQFASW